MIQNSKFEANVKLFARHFDMNVIADVLKL